MSRNTKTLLKYPHYYPFGLMMSGRSWSEGYRFGFNGQEQDDAVYGEGILNTALYWEYDTRLGRRWNVDPVSSIAPSWSPYRAFFDSPILYSDPSGLYEDPKNGAQRFWNTVTFRGKYNRFADHKATIESLGGKVVNEDFSGKSIKYDVLSTSIGTETFDNITFSSIEQDLTSWEFEGTSDKDLALAFNMSLSVGDFNPFYGSVVGGGSARPVYPEVILMPMPKLGVVFKSVLSKAAASSIETMVTKGVSPNVQRVLNTLDDSKAQGGSVKLNTLNPTQEINMTFQKGTQKLDFRIETHTVPQKYGGNGLTPQRHMNVDLYPNKKVLPNSGHKILE